MPISSYPQYMSEVGGKGTLALYPEHHADTVAASATIPWGKAVQYTATNKNKGEVYAGTRKVIGVAMANHYAEYRTTTTVGEYVVGDAVSALRKGCIWVEVLEDVVKGDLAVADNTTGNFRPSTTGTATISAIVGEFKSSALANGLAILELNLPNA
ncbi:structural cement protein Gp24 [Paenibacillus periandrae]|uniref:structural cement protein Gp24 n=1 Tax=Paenibacillus periandrae TaxID=1761741 RepID=UPI001F0973C5|nr:hypothetical protein [Paenibacillus periandrae]